MIYNAGLWCIVNNAGIAMITESEWCSMKTYQRHLDVNLLAPIRVSKVFLPIVRQARGRIVNMASLAGKVPSKSKGAPFRFSNITLG